MNPIVATSLINLGGSILGKAIPSSVPSIPPSGTRLSFEDSLNRSLPAPVAPPIDLEKTKDTLVTCPELSDFLSRNQGNRITLDEMADGSIRFLSSSGDFTVLGKGSAAWEPARQYLNGCLQTQCNLSTDRIRSAVLLS